MAILDDVLRAAQIGETSDWEFKSARGGFPGSFWETYSAMANAEGGVVVLGVREDGDTARLDGLSAEQVARYQKTLWDGLNNRGQVSVNLLDASQVEVVGVGDAQLLVVKVPRASRTQRPVHLGGNPFGHTYRRRHEGDYRCDDVEVRRMFADADNMPADHRVLEAFSLDDLDAATLTQYRQRIRAAKGEHPWLALDDRELLRKLGGWRRDRESGHEGPTLAGLLAFGKDEAIRDPAAAPAYFVDYREKLDPATRWSDRIYPDGAWEANLLQFYQRVWPRLGAGISTPFQLEGEMRRDVTPAHEGLREAFVNALIHADYSVGGGVVVERYTDRFVIENPGTLLVSLEQYRHGGVSECRNRALQTIFLMIGGGEKAGSGTDKIRAGWQTRHWRTPLITLSGPPDRVRLVLPMVSLIPDETLERLRVWLGAEFDTLTPQALQALATADLEQGVSNARLQELLEDHPVDITRLLQRLCSRGLLLSDNRRRWTTYRLGGVATGGPSVVRDSLPLVVDSSPFGGDSLPLGADSSPLGADSSPSLQTEAELVALATPVASRGKVPAAEMRRTIVRLCTGRHLPAERLGRLLNRNPERLRTHFLTPMVRDRLLQLRYPESPNRPDQTYTATETPR